MRIKDDDYTKLEKINVFDLLDLCLCVPKGYTDTSNIQYLRDGAIGSIKVQILSQSIKNKMLKINAFSTKFSAPITLYIFNAKSFHRKTFSAGLSLLIYGKLKFYSKEFSITQPKIISSINQISLHFKIPSIRDKTLQDLCQKYLTRENLSPLIPQKIINNILPIFFPTPEFLSQYDKNKNFPKPCIQALKFIEIYQHIKRLNHKRRYFPAKFSCSGSYKNFIASLPFDLTPSQKTTISEIAMDLQKPIAAKRVIMGDVGCGKTIVILASVMIAYPKKSILMVPTTILAEQIFEEAKKFLPSSLKIACVLSKNKKFANEDFIIGTQALLFQEFDAKDFALIMVDEQHRFGTNQRHYLEQIFQSDTKQKPHYLQFSATPIPRTLSMMESSLVDFSFIKDLPFKKDISTQIIHKNHFNQLLAHIKNEINNHRQVIIVYPLVESSEHIDYLSIAEGAPFWQKHFDQVHITYGQDKNKDEILKDFRDNGDILLATTLIEVGISLPKLSTIVIIAPERLGLATLHQLRGRVSRNGLKGYCFLYTHLQNSSRLQDFSSKLSGFDIAEIDLKYRSAGDLLSGWRQSGQSFKFFDFAEDGEIIQSAREFLAQQKNQNL